MTGEVELVALGERFACDMHRGLLELARLGYDATLFRQMLDKHGAVEAARRLVLAKDPSYGLCKLKTLGRLDMSVEMWVLLPWYGPLFGPEVREQAERKLRLLEVDLEPELHNLIHREDPTSGGDNGVAAAADQ
ncbi:hypothetical protein GCM10010174_35140 [Kutzneria viridogrisea]|uniref:Uncharacterized protein n=2 Tax=Kutzneria TaxID=43356 RepID=W5W186_9PSEU|nr:hypothetical protein [Kutzneria albida]AHH94943.1 hypothetical protein KALB_1571 [Kutzneria albida DSM 43870]MBA8927725.1 hypothetical protein [Kutzneria viridogrisea]